MSENYKSEFYINGEWHESSNKLPVTNPATGELISNISLSNEMHCELALESAFNASKDWAESSPRFRSEILRKAYEIMISRLDELAKLISLENGKVLSEAKGEVLYAAEFFRWFAEEAVRISGDFRLSPSGDKRIVVTHDPVGVSLLITPWNFPAAMATRKIGPAFAAGCTVILKPATETPLTSLAIAEILEIAGAPKGTINVLLPENTASQVKNIMLDTRVRNVSFTGSTEVGKILLETASKRVLRTSMELGGNAPLLVLGESDVNLAVKGSILAKMRNGGAACTAANRLYVHKKIAKEFINNFSQAMEKIVMLPGMEPGAELGANVSIRERDKIAELVAQAISDGGTLRTGGFVPHNVGAFYPPTVIEVDRNNSILNNEIFGPVAPIVVVDSDEEAIEQANASDFGLISYVFAENLEYGLNVAKKLESGVVAVNRGVVSDPAAPFGGYKQSGIGREGGFDGIHEFLETKYIGIDS